MNNKKSKRRCSVRMSGFSLLEMLVVLVIIGLLAGLVGPRLFTQVDKAKVNTAEAQIKMMKGALETFRLDVNRFPNKEEGLSVLWKAPVDEKAKDLWNGPYLDEAIPDDPWSNPYQYSIPGADNQPYALYSLGADGQRGGEGINKDLGYLPPEGD